MDTRPTESVVMQSVSSFPIKVCSLKPGAKFNIIEIVTVHQITSGCD